MTPEDMIDHIDVMVLSGDCLYDDNKRAAFKEYLHRWQKRVSEIESERLEQLKDAARAVVGEADLGEVDLDPEEREKLDELRRLSQ